MIKDTRKIKWNITINNPIEHNLVHDNIKEALAKLKSLTYYCLADEKGETYHTHLYVHFSNVVRFSTIKNIFPSAHIEPAKGTAQQNREYIEKSGKWENDTKHGTKIDGTFEEWGELPIERQGRRSDFDELYDLICSKATNTEIYKSNPSHMKHHTLIEKVRQDILFQENKGKDRLLDVTYIYGCTGVGKTRTIYNRHNAEDVCRVTDYKHPFDNYTGQPILVFDEFRSQLTISAMLNYLDIYPTELPARYVNKQACYTIVYIVSNWTLFEQYKNVQADDTETWKAFLRRIQKVYEMTPDGLSERNTDDPIQPFSSLPDDTPIPPHFVA